MADVKLKTQEELALMRESGRLLASVFAYLDPHVKTGATLGDIGHAIQQHARINGYSVMREYCGHGIGRQMHKEPAVLHYSEPSRGLAFKEGMTFTIEPIINQGSAKIKTKRDGWTVVTRDKKLSAQWEHTIAVTADGYQVLTLRDEERSA